MGRLSFGVKIIVAFFAFDAVAKGALAIAVAATAATRGVDAHALADRYFPIFLALCFDVLLAVQLALRTRAGRFWAIIYLVASTALGLFLLVAEPTRWLDLGRNGRLREVASYGINVGFLAILAGRRAGKVLVR